MRPHPCNHRNLGTVNDTPTAVLHDPIWKIVNVVRRFWRMCRSTVITAVRTVLLRTCAAREHWRTIGSSQHRVVFSQTCRECQLCSRRNSHNPPPSDGCKASAKLVLWPQTRWTQITATFGKALYELCPESHQLPWQKRSEWLQLGLWPFFTMSESSWWQKHRFVSLSPLRNNLILATVEPPNNKKQRNSRENKLNKYGVDGQPQDAGGADKR